MSLNKATELVLRFINSPTGPKTTHFWGPTLNWGWAVQGYVDRNRPAEKISRDFEICLMLYSGTFMRFAWKVKPRNYLLFASHLMNFIFQGNLLRRRLEYDADRKRQGLPVVANN